MAKSHFGVLLFSAYLPVQKNPRRARIGNLPVDIQIIQRAGVGVADMLVDPAFIKFTEVGFCEDGTALGLVHGGAEQVFHIMHRHDYRCTGRVKGAEQIFTAVAHGALTVTALDVDGVAPVAACGAQELAEMRIGGSKTGNGQNITPISNCAQCNNSAQFYKMLPVCGKVFISGTGVSVRSSYMARYPSEDFCQPPSCQINTTRLSFICMTLNVMLSAIR